MTPFLEDMDESLYEKRSPIWNQDLRLMLAATIHRHLPADEDFLRTSNVPPTTSSQSTPRSDSNNSEATTTANEPFKVFQPSRQRLAQELTLQQFQHIRPPPPSPALPSIPLIAIVQAMLDLNEDQKKRQRRQILHVNIKKEETDDVTIKYLAVIVPKVITLLPSLYLPAVIHRSLPFIQIFNNNNNP